MRTRRAPFTVPFVAVLFLGLSLVYYGAALRSPGVSSIFRRGFFKVTTSEVYRPPRQRVMCVLRSLW